MNLICTEWIDRLLFSTISEVAKQLVQNVRDYVIQYDLIVWFSTTFEVAKQLIQNVSDYVIQYDLIVLLAEMEHLQQENVAESVVDNDRQEIIQGRNKGTGCNRRVDTDLLKEHGHQGTDSACKGHSDH